MAELIKLSFTKKLKSNFFGDAVIFKLLYLYKVCVRILLNCNFTFNYNFHAIYYFFIHSYLITIFI